MWTRLASLVALTCVALATECNPNDPPGDGYLVLSLTTANLVGTAFANLGPVEVNIIRTDVVHRSVCTDPNTETVLTVSNQPYTAILSPGSTNVQRRLTPQLPVPAGCVMQVRGIIGSMTAALSNKTEPVKLPSGTQTGLKIVPIDETKPFTITANATTLVRVDYDPNQSLVFNKGQGFLEKPVLEGVQLDSSFTLGVILDEVVLTFDPKMSDAAIASVVASGGGTIKSNYPHGFVTVKLPNTDELVDRTTFYSQQSGVLVAVPNTLVDLQGPNAFNGTPNDPLYSAAPPAGFEQTNLGTVNTPQAWSVTTGADDVIIAVVDSGFDLLQADLMNNLWINEGEIPPPVLKKLQANGMPVNGLHYTFVDLNLPVNNDPTICNKVLAGDPTMCDPLDLVDGKGTVGYGWQDGQDNDSSGKPDDLFGWDFSSGGEGDNLPEPFSLCTVSPPNQCPDGSSRIPWHGTGVAGVAAGIGNNGVGAPGVAWHGRIMLIKGDLVVNPSGTSFQSSIDDRLKRDSIVRGVAYAEKLKANVINLSSGSVITTADLANNGVCDRGIQLVPQTKFAPGIQMLANEWENVVGPDQANSVFVVSVNDCAEDDDAPNTFDYPVGFVRARPDLNVSFVHSTMISVTSVENVDYTPTLNNKPPVPITNLNAVSVSSFAARGAQTVLIGAPGENWRLAQPQAFPETAIGTGVEDCTELSPSGFLGATFCSGTSFAAPMVAGAAALVFANHASNGVTNAADVKARIINNAFVDVSLQNAVAGQHLLDIQSAVGP
jgi:hypothetical protein